MTYDEFLSGALMFFAFLMGWWLSDLLKMYGRHRSGGTVKPADHLKNYGDLQRWLDNKTMEQAKRDRESALRYDEAIATISQQLVALGYVVSYERPGRSAETIGDIGPMAKVSIDPSFDGFVIESGDFGGLYKLSHAPSSVSRAHYYFASAQAFHEYVQSAASQPQPITPI